MALQGRQARQQRGGVAIWRFADLVIMEVNGPELRDPAVAGPTRHSGCGGQAPFSRRGNVPTTWLMAAPEVVLLELAVDVLLGAGKLAAVVPAQINNKVNVVPYVVEPCATRPAHVVLALVSTRDRSIIRSPNYALPLVREV